MYEIKITRTIKLKTLEDVKAKLKQIIERFNGKDGYDINLSVMKNGKYDCEYNPYADAFYEI